MPKLPVLSGEELIKALKKAGYEVVRRKGSHVALPKVSTAPLFLSMMSWQKVLYPTYLSKAVYHVRI